MLDAKILPIKFKFKFALHETTSSLRYYLLFQIIKYYSFNTFYQYKKADLRCSYTLIAIDIYGELVNIFEVTEENSQGTQIRASGIDRANEIFSEMPLYFFVAVI